MVKLLLITVDTRFSNGLRDFEKYRILRILLVQRACGTRHLHQSRFVNDEYSARHLNPTFLYGGFFNLNEVTRAK